jgi:mlo protein
MVLGFISLLLTVFQPVVASLCMPERLRKSMLPCAYDANANETSTCAAGEVQIISVESLHQIHLFIFVLAIVHVCYSCITVLLGFLKVHAWNKWEQETRQENFDCAREGQSGWFLCDPPASVNKNESNK